MKKYVKLLLIAFVLVLGTILPCGIVFRGGFVNASSGIYVENGAELEVNGGVMQNNANKAITINGGTHTIENTKISGSTNGAIHILNGAIVTVNNSVIVDNSNTGNGGAIYVGEGSTLVLNNTTISNNISSKNGGAIYADKNAVVTIGDNCLISDNKANYGGGIYLAEGALANNGESIISAFENNQSLADTNVWQNVFYQQVSVGQTKEGIVDSNNIIVEQQDMLSNLSISNFAEDTYNRKGYISLRYDRSAMQKYTRQKASAIFAKRFLHSGKII